MKFVSAIVLAVVLLHVAGLGAATASFFSDVSMQYTNQNGALETSQFDLLKLQDVMLRYQAKPEAQIIALEHQQTTLLLTKLPQKIQPCAWLGQLQNTDGVQLYQGIVDQCGTMIGY